MSKETTKLLIVQHFQFLLWEKSSQPKIKKTMEEIKCCVKQAILNNKHNSKA